MRVYNTLSRSMETFQPIDAGKVHMYNCGPTVYYYPQIGNWRAYVFVDTLKRTLLYLGYDVKQVMNITDVGHLTSDEDSGEDKLEKGARRENKTVWEVAQFYIDDFISSREILNILPPDILARATDHIPQQIEMIQKLIDKGYAYVTKEAVYFDVSRFEDYTKLSRQKLEEKETAVREEVVVDPNKRTPQDFRLWQLDRPDHQMLWESPWGRGFPGWHIECSAMSTYYLGQPFDIHTGGVDHIPVHHTNELAQAEAANGVKFVNYWMHNEFLTIDGGRMGKSLGNAYSLHDIKNFLMEEFSFDSKNFPLALRYLFLTAHYRNKLDFTKESLFASFNALYDLYKSSAEVYKQTVEKEGVDFVNELISKSERNILKGLNDSDNVYIKSLINNIENDLNTASVIADLNIMLKDESIDSGEKLTAILEYDKILGLRIMENTLNYIFDFNDKEKEQMEERIAARERKDYQRSDELRKSLEKVGIEVLDKKDKTLYYRK